MSLYRRGVVARRHAAGAAPPAAKPLVSHWRNQPTIDAGLTWQQRYDRAVSQFGAFNGHRSNYHGTGAGTLSAAELAAIDAGQELAIYWKPGLPWTNVTNGSRDSVLLAAANSVKSRPASTIWMNFHHEPEDDLIVNGGTAGTAAEFAAMFRYCVDFFRAQGVTNCLYNWIIMSSIAHPSDLASLWPGNGYVDIVGVQRYLNSTSTTPDLAARFDTDLTYFQTNYSAGTRNWRPLKADGSGDVPFVFSEWGADLDARGTASHRADQIDSITAALANLTSWGVLEVRIFDARTNYLEAKPSVDAVAYQTMKDTYQA